MVLLLAISILLQLIAALLALRLVTVTKHRTAWGCLAVALVLMTLRRAVTLYHSLIGDGKPFDPTVEWVALAISILMVIGVAMLRPLFVAVQQQSELVRVAAEERLEIERQLAQAQRGQSLGLMASGVAHEFNNLLTVIIGNQQLARDQAIDAAAVRHHLDQADQATMRAADLARQLVAYTGSAARETRQTDLSALVAGMRELLRASVSRDVSIDLRLATVPVMVSADASQLQQCLLNLVLNANDAIGERSGLIVIRTELVLLSVAELELFEASGLQTGWYGLLSVTDSGAGIDRESIGRIFDPFFSTKGLGRGLGLSAVLGIVKAHGGAVKVESQPGTGSRFSIIVPAESSESSTPGGGPQSGPRFETLRVLLVDDEPAVLTVAKHALDRAGMQVLTASDGKEALELLARHHAEVDLVLLDLTMPRVGGLQVLRVIKERYPDLRAVMTSGYDSAAFSFDEFGSAVPFLKKPYRSEQLLEAIQSALKRA